MHARRLIDMFFFSLVESSTQFKSSFLKGRSLPQFRAVLVSLKGDRRL